MKRVFIDNTDKVDILSLEIVYPNGVELQYVRDGIYFYDRNGFNKNDECLLDICLVNNPDCKFVPRESFKSHYKYKYSVSMQKVFVENKDESWIRKLIIKEKEA